MVQATSARFGPLLVKTLRPPGTRVLNHLLDLGWFASKTVASLELPFSHAV